MPHLSHILTTLRNALPELQSRYAVQSLAIFGSVARGDDRPDSDVDIVVTFLPTATVTLFHLIRMKAALEDLLHCEVDLITQGSMRPRMREAVNREAVRVA